MTRKPGVNERLATEVDAALDRGYLVLGGGRMAEHLEGAYYSAARGLGLMFVILRLVHATASVTWNGDAVQDRGYAEHGPFGGRQEYRYPIQLDTAPLAEPLKPFLFRSRSRQASLHTGGYYGGLFCFNREDGHDVARLVAAWFRERLPGPQTRADFDASLDWLHHDEAAARA